MIILQSAHLLIIREKPGMYFVPPLFPALCNYIYGVEDCYRSRDVDEPLFQELVSFTNWLPKKLDIPLPPMGWRQIILERAKRDRVRVQMFVDFFLQHRQECKFFWDGSEQLLIEAAEAKEVGRRKEFIQRFIQRTAVQP
jgi:hypothetical protein